MITDIIDVIASHGDRGAVVQFSHIDDLKKDMFDLQNGEYHTDWLCRMAKHILGEENKFIPPDITFKPRSLISIIMPNPKVILRFHYHSSVVHCVVPPHYTDWYEKNDRALQYLEDYLTPRGFSVAIVKTITQKLLAVHCGLAFYGRNNICYNDEFGSHMQIMTYVTDLPCDEGVWFPIKRMGICEKCHACVASCPTRAIDSNRQLINSDRCITYINEQPDVTFPEWIDKDAHNSIVGCTKCQDCCPGNARNKNNTSIGISFTESETFELVNHKGEAPYSESLAAKIGATGIPPEYSKPSVLPRNLVSLFTKNA